MPSKGEIIQALTGSLMLARGDPQGQLLFDQTMAGFWRSFTAIILVAPVLLIAEHAQIAMVEAAGEPVPATGAGFSLGRLATLTVEWFAYPIAMVPMARLLGLGPRYAPYIIAYNWTSVLIAAAVLVPGLLFAIGLIPSGLARGLIVAVYLWQLYFRYWIARSALETGIATSIGLVVFDVSLTLLIDNIARSLLR